MRPAKVLGQTHSLRVLAAVSVYSLRLPPFSSSACDLEMQSGSGVQLGEENESLRTSSADCFQYALEMVVFKKLSFCLLVHNKLEAVEGQELYRLSSRCFMWLKFLI